MAARIAILTAVRQELAPLARRLRPCRTAPPRPRYFFSLSGAVAGVEVVLCAGGVGPTRAAEATVEILDVWTPDLLLVAGVAGALDPALRIADIVAADQLLGPAPAPPPGTVPAPVGDLHSYHRGALLSLDRVLVSPDEKQAARASALPAVPLAVEMETAGAVRIAVERSIPWAAVRAVSDTSADTLPLDFNRLRDPDGDLPTTRVAMAALAQPTSIAGLLRLGRNTSLAAEALAEFLIGWLAQPPER